MKWRGYVERLSDDEWAVKVVCSLKADGPDIAWDALEKALCLLEAPRPAPTFAEMAAVAPQVIPHAQAAAMIRDGVADDDEVVFAPPTCAVGGCQGD